jgi:hypothetical protein
VRPSARPAGATPDRRYAVEQVKQLRDVVAIRGGQRPRERDTAAIYEEVVLAAFATAIDGAGTRFRAPFFACR